jgi:hypothetical protein
VTARPRNLGGSLHTLRRARVLPATQLPGVASAGPRLNLHGHQPVLDGCGASPFYARLLRALAGVQLLILDDWGLQPLDAGAHHDLLEILEEPTAGARPSSPARARSTNGTR